MLDYGLFSSLVVCLSVVHTCQAGFSTELSSDLDSTCFYSGLLERYG